MRYGSVAVPLPNRLYGTPPVSVVSFSAVPDPQPDITPDDRDASSLPTSTVQTSLFPAANSRGLPAVAPTRYDLPSTSVMKITSSAPVTSRGATTAVNSWPHEGNTAPATGLFSVFILAIYWPVPMRL